MTSLNQIYCVSNFLLHTDIYFNMYLGKCIYFLNEMLKELNKKGTPVPKMKDFVLSAIKFIDKTEEKIIVKEYEQFFTQNSPEQVKKWINASHSLNRPLIVGIKNSFYLNNMEDMIFYFPSYQEE